MDFVAIDFETANNKKTSACSIGLAEYKNEELLDSFHYYIKPEPYYFSSFNTALHGINKETVQDAPTFDVLWQEIKYLFEGRILVAHNASFDISVLRSLLDFYSIPYPKLNYYCTCLASRRTWRNLYNYKLSTVANYLGYEFKHHDAMEDTMAAAKIMIKIFELNDCSNFENLGEKLNYTLGSLACRNYF